MEVSFRTHSELLQNSFRRHSESFGTHSEFIQNLCRTYSEVILESSRTRIQNAFRAYSELIPNSFGIHSEDIQENVQEPFMSHPGVFQVSFGIQLELIQN